MAKKCLVTKHVNKLATDLGSGKLDSFKLSQMSPSARRAKLSEYVGESNASWVNAEFESKLILKNQQKGLINWVGKMAGLKPTVRRDLISRIENLDKALSKSGQTAFLKDLTEQRLGFSVTKEEVDDIMEMSRQLKNIGKGNEGYGDARVALRKYIQEHSPKERFRDHPIRESLSIARALKTGFDLSAFGRQGLAMMSTKEYYAAVGRTIGRDGYALDPEALDRLESRMYEHEYTDLVLAFKNELGVTLLGESFTQREEEFASVVIKKIPILAGSARAYEGFLNDLRFTRFVNQVKALEKAGVPGFVGKNKDKEAIKQLAIVIAGSSGRGTLGQYENAAGSLATIFFSPRWVMSKIQLMTNPITKIDLSKPGLQKFTPASREAARHLVVPIAIMTGVALGLSAMSDDIDIEWDPRATDFGKVKIGNTRTDIFAGTGAYAVLATRTAIGTMGPRLAPDLMAYKNSRGELVPLNDPKYGKRSVTDLWLSFFGNKLSPYAGSIRDYVRGETFDFEPINVGMSAKDQGKYLWHHLLVPMLYEETTDAMYGNGDEAMDKLKFGSLGLFGAVFGFSTSTYEPRIKKRSGRKRQRGRKAPSRPAKPSRSRSSFQPF